MSRTPLHRLAFAVTLLAAIGLYAYAFSAEPAYGALRGRVLVSDTGWPLAGVSVVVRPATPQHGADSRSAETDKEGVFRIARLPVGSYEIETYTSVYKNVPLTLSVSEGQTATAEMKLEPNDPFLNLYVHQHAYLPEDTPRFALNGFRQGDAIKLRMYAVDGATLARDYGSNLRKLLTPVSTTGGPETYRALRSGKYSPVRTWTHPIRERDAEGVFYEYEPLGKLKPGVYLIEAQGAKTSALGWLMVTDMALVTKAAGNRLLAFTVDLRTGRPIPGAQLSVFHLSAPAVRKATNPSGLADLRIGTSGSDSVDVVALRGDSVAFTRFYPSDYGSGRDYRVFTSTDRPVYRPGHRVHFKGIVRRPEGPAYAVPSPRTLEVEVRDGMDTVLYSEDVSLNDRGSFAGTFDLPQEARGGYYTLAVSIDDEEYTDGFVVASYRKPEWKVDVTAPKPRYIRGERVPVTIHAEYFYGAPVTEASVHYTVYRSRYWAWRDEEGEEEDGYADSYGDVVTEGDLKTDGGGSARFEFPTELSASDDRSGEYQYNVEVEVTDLSNRIVTGNGTVRVSPGELTIEARPARFFAPPNATVPVQVRVRDFQDRPAPRVSLNATVTLEEWDGKKSLQRPLANETLQTDAQGGAQFPVQLAGPGLVIVKLAATDARGNRVETSTEIWVSTAEGGDLMPTYPSISVTADRKLYRVGDTAQILLNTDRPGATAIVAVEAEEILDFKLVPLKNRSTVVRFPIRPGFEPNVFVTACFVKNREFVSSQARLNVDPEAHRLQVTITSDLETYRPGDLATFHVQTADGKGRPVPAEVSFGLVDESVYAIVPEDPGQIWNAFYPRRRNEVRTEFSYPDVYLGDADKDGADIAIRKKFPDTAHWDPFLKTDSQGEATVQVRLPDSLTSWRATVLAHSPKTEVGEARHNIRVAKDLTLRLQTPRTLTEGDRLTLSAVVHNYSPGQLNVSVNLQVSGLTVPGQTAQQVRIDPGKAQSVTWEAQAQTSGKAIVTATAVAGGLTDGVQLTVPVRAFAKESVLYRTGALSADAAREEFNIDPAAAEARMELRLSPTLAGTMLGSLEYLVDYPYGCTEQTTSSFLADVVVLRTLKALGLRRPELERRVPAMAREGLVRLAGFQQSNGGWGWWEYDQPDPWMTAYVLFGMNVAREAGIDVNEQVYDNGVNALAQIAESENLSADQAMFVAYVLAKSHAVAKARKLLQKWEKEQDRLQLRSLGYRALALAATGKAEDRRKAEAVVQYLWTVAENSSGQVHWSEKRPLDRWYDVPQDVESTAVVLKAAVAVTPKDPRLGGVVRWLLLRRHGGRWESTRDTAWILFALADYLKATGELNSDYNLTVLLNGKQLHAEQVSPEDAPREETIIRVPLKDLAEANRVEVRKTGNGTAYYALQVTQQIRAPQFRAESTVPGLSIRREYFRLATRRDAGGRAVVEAEKNPTGSARIGDRLLVRLRIHSDRPLEYLMLEDPLPAGLEVQDRGEVSYEEWSYWWSHMDVRDDRVTFFMRSLGKGDHVLEYYVRPEMSGTVRTLPAVLSDMYAPETRASTAETRLEVGR
jgi:alpha-2-macroglobulin